MACSDNDSFSTSRSDLLTFEADTIELDTIFSTVASPTYAFWVFNHSSDGIRLSTIRLKKGNQTGFRVNVDGSYLDNTMGSLVNDIEVRKGDSIHVFVELTAPENKQQDVQLIEDDLVFQLESGVVQQVNLRCYTWDAISVSNLTIESDTVIESSKPMVVYGEGIKVDSGAVLTLRNTTLYFHDNAGINVGGTLKTENVTMRGDRLDHMFENLPYDRVSGQWRGISFERTSTQNVMTDTEIRNAVDAVVLEDFAEIDTLSPRLTMIRCKIHNADGYGVLSYNSNIGLYYCQLSNTANDCLALYGGYANIRFSSLFGTNLGARRYVDPMTGQWTTVPIINPYINIGGGRLEIPLGDLLKTLVWDRNDRSRQRAWEENKMNFNPMNGFNPSNAPVVQPPRPVRPPMHR